MDLTTARLRLRGLKPADAPFVLALVNDPSFIRHIGDRNIRTLEDAARYIESGPWTRSTEPGIGLQLVQLRDSGEAIGICGLLKRDALDAPDIGFAFLPAHRSKGYAFEAASAVREHARDVLGWSRLLAIISPDNTASIRLIEKLGFRFERMAGLSPEAAEIAVYASRSDTIPAP